MLRLVRSTSVRLALGYAALFVISSLLLVGLLWWGTAAYLDRETAAVIRSDIQAIKDELPYRGLPGAVTTIQDQLGASTDGQAVYLLADQSLKPIVGNLQVWPSEVASKPGWYQVPLALAGRFRTIEIEEVALPGGLHLLVGRDIEDRGEVRALIVRGLGWAAVGAFVIAIAGGLLVRRAVLRRVETINSTASAIVHGDLSRRLPIHDSSDEFDQLAKTINLMLSQIEQLIEGVRNTSNAIAHDLRTPLAELRAQLEELTRVRQPRSAMLDGVHKAVSDIDRVIGVFNALLRLAEIDSGVRRSGFRLVDLGELATEVAELYEPLAEEKHVAFIVDAPEGLAIKGDPHLLAQAVGNLIDNAFKYTPENGIVSLRMARADGHIEMIVADNGPGISASEKPRVVERFYRCHDDGMVDGTGLGLSLVESVARLHDGELLLTDNAPGLRAILSIPTKDAGNRPKSVAASAIDRAEAERELHGLNPIGQAF